MILLDSSGAISSLNLLVESIPIKYGRFNSGIKSPSSVASIKILALYSEGSSFTLILKFSFLTTSLTVEPYKIVKLFSCLAISLSILFPTDGSNIKLLTQPVFRLSK